MCTTWVRGFTFSLIYHCEHSERILVLTRAVYSAETVLTFLLLTRPTVAYGRYGERGLRQILQILRGTRVQVPRVFNAVNILVQEINQFQVPCGPTRASGVGGLPHLAQPSIDSWQWSLKWGSEGGRAGRGEESRWEKEIWREGK